MAKRPTLMSCKQVAKLFKVDEAHVRHLAKQHGVGFKVGHSWLFSMADIRRLEKRPSVGRPRH